MSKFAGMALEVDKPERMTIVHPGTRQPLRDEKGNEAFIDLHSGDSDVARKHGRAVANRRLGMRGRVKLTAQELEADAAELLSALTAGWLLLDLTGQPIEVEFSRENARELFTEPGLAWLREQVDEFVADRGNFSKASPKT